MIRRVRAALFAGCSLLSFASWFAGPAVAQNKMYWTDSDANRVWSANRDGTAAAPLITLDAGSEPRGIAVDANHGHIYWTENGTNRIRRADLDGTNIVNLPIPGPPNFPADIEIDVRNGKIYWADRDANQIYRANTDGSNFETVTDLDFTTQNATPYFLTIVEEWNDLYWSDFDSGTIHWSSLTSSDAEDFITGLDRVRDIAVDPQTEMFYWADRDTRLIQRQRFDGTGRQTLYGPATLNRPHGLALDAEAGLLYWADSDGRTIYRGSVDGSTPLESLVTATNGLVNPWDIALDTVVIPEPATSALFVFAAIALALSVRKKLGKIGEKHAHPLGKAARDRDIGLKNLFSPIVSFALRPIFFAEGVPMRSGIRAALIGGFVLVFAGLLAGFAVAQNKMYWTDSQTNRVYSANRDGTGVVSLITLAAGSEPRGLAVDANHGHIYWTENGTNRIRRANLDGSNMIDLPITGLNFPADIELDLIHNKLYWADPLAHQIGRSNLDGTSQETVLDPPGAAADRGPYFLALDVPADRLYWSELNNTIIHRATLDGAGDVTYAGGFVRTRDMAVDAVAGKIYWADRDARLIYRQNLDGTSRETLYGPAGLTRPHGVALDTDAGFVYWADSDGRTVFRGSLDGSTPLTVLVGPAAGLLNPWDVALDTIVIPEPATSGLAALVVAATAAGLLRHRHRAEKRGKIA